MDIDFVKIKQLREEIQELLEKNPELKELQDEIENKLSNCKNQRQRNELLHDMMIEKWSEAIQKFDDLGQMLIGEPTKQEKYQAILDNRVRLRCTNKDCQLSRGFWTAKSFRDDYVNIIGCSQCGSKLADELKEV